MNKQLTKRQKEKVNKIRDILIDLQRENVYAFAASTPSDWLIFVRDTSGYNKLNERINSGRANTAWSDIVRYNCGSHPGLVFSLAL